MRTIPGHVPAAQRCGHCGMPDAMHTSAQRATCEKRLLADLSRSWPRTVKTRAELDARTVKKLRAATEAIVEVARMVELSPEERASIDAATDVLASHIAKRSVEASPHSDRSE